MEKWKGQEESGKSHLPGAEEVTGSVAGAEERREGRPRRRETTWPRRWESLYQILSIRGAVLAAFLFL